MTTYAFQRTTASLLLHDTPLTYEPSRGPGVPLTLSYHHRDSLQPQAFTFANVGPNGRLKCTGFVGGLIPREDGAHGTTQQVLA